MPIDCAPPATWADLATWSADDGWPAELRDEVGHLVDTIMDGAWSCPLVSTDESPWPLSGGCVTGSGYTLDLDGAWGGGSLRFDATITPTDAADGTLPTGSLSVRVDDTDSGTDTYGGSGVDIVASWAFEDTGGFALPLEGTLDSDGGTSWGGCGTGRSAEISGVADGCTFAVTLDRNSYTSAARPLESYTFAGDTWSAEITYDVCGTRLGTWDGARARLDADWNDLGPFTDLDGDGCAVEDCDCDDADAGIHPGARDTRGDGVDSDCVEGDDPDRDDCYHVVDACPPAPVDTGGADTGVADTGAPDTGVSDTSPTDTGAPTDTAPTDTAPSDTAPTDTDPSPTCALPSEWADLAAWRADTGIPALAFGDLDDLVDAIGLASASGCPAVDTSSSTATWSGGCVTPNGYALEMSGTSWSAGDDGAGEDWEISLAPTDAADGAWPTGTLRIARDATLGTRTIAAEWSFVDAGATSLPLDGALTGGWGDGGGCSPYIAGYTGTFDGCVFSSDWESVGHHDGRLVRDWYGIVIDGEPAGIVATELCGTRVGTHGRERVWLDAAWNEVERTDADGDLCAVEDCDCDDADASVRPGAADTPGDGRDDDCNGDDGPHPDDCPSVWDTCAPAADPDTGPTDTGPTDTAPIDTAPTDTAPTDTVAGDPDPACGCASPSGPRAAAFLGLLALLGLRRRPPTG